MRQVFGEWGVVTETKSASYGNVVNLSPEH